ncbi:sigma-70 family RNA polymerase sigma factor [Roseimicrobium sp. ORNL1]|uniref:RNA polymerase sigma factor n=1 Tax=Roseimicrobium sp. ORNL1 TaxID=2711231 RepID=UPI0013E19A85|nr:sigma-70 family RNA polymerase sigma factor [Roseimicrobium sp. ORNL1]QIF04578.1 sigma-70 family RNA polymerase sigma factor [Roseimicrobium sp. ORNL1]
MKTDLALLQRYHHHGDASAFAELVRTHAGMVYATAQRVTRDAALAEDVAQEAFLKLARASHQTIESVGAWLHHVTRQRACDAIRSKVARQRYEPVAEHWHDSMPAHEASWTEIEPLVDEVLDALPEESRTLLVEQCAQQEIAQRMGVSQSTISRKIETALQALRDGLAKNGVLCGAGFAGLLTTHSAQAAPPTLVTSLNKVSMAGAGMSATGALAASSVLITMTTTTKILLATGAVAAIGIPLILHHSGDGPASKLPVVSTASSQPQTQRGFATFTPASKPEPVVDQQSRQLTEEEKQWEEAMAIPDDRALILAYFKKLGGRVREEYVEQDIAKVVKDNFGGSQAALEQELLKDGLTLDQFRQKRQEDMIIAVMKARATQDINIADPKKRAIAKEEAFKEWIQELRENGGKGSR